MQVKRFKTEFAETYYFDDGTLDFGYDSDFTQYDAQVYLFGYDLPG